ncbi:MAG TPA: hypothetical protein VMU19_12390 [Bryobacteraceae bacterium]|nr:hypothetical protein [Bryobacteraceae bacterium]
MRTRDAARWVVLALLAAPALLAQDYPLPAGSINVSFPGDSPVLFSGLTDQSRGTARGSAMVIDLRVSMVLRNVSANRQIHGVTLRVVSQEVAVGGKGSVTYPSLHVGPGESFPVRIEMQLMRPTQAVNGPLVQVSLDGVLFGDLTFYGDNRLNSKRIMTAEELEARRDREYYKRVLQETGVNGLRSAVLESLVRQSERPRLDARVTRGGPSVASSAAPVQSGAENFAFLKFPDSPVAPVGGSAQVSGNEARDPRVEVRNNSSKDVRYFELSWLVSDANGQQYLAASLPASDPALLLKPSRTAQAAQDTALRFTRNGEPLNVGRMTGFVSQVEFADGQMWIPSRQALENASLMRLIAPSAEEQRLTDLYRRSGMNALVEDLKKY